MKLRLFYSIIALCLTFHSKGQLLNSPFVGIEVSNSPIRGDIADGIMRFSLPSIEGSIKLGVSRKINEKIKLSIGGNFGVRKKMHSQSLFEKFDEIKNNTDFPAEFTITDKAEFQSVYKIVHNSDDFIHYFWDIEATLSRDIKSNLGAEIIFRYRYFQETEINTLDIYPTTQFIYPGVGINYSTAKFEFSIKYLYQLPRTYYSSQSLSSYSLGYSFDNLSLSIKYSIKNQTQ